MTHQNTLKLHSKGELTEDSIRPFLDAFTDAGTREMVEETLEGFDGFDMDVALHEGTLTVDALNLEDLDVGLLVVDGDLVVNGPYLDSCNDAPDIVLIRGDLRANAVFTAGSLEVTGDLIAESAIVGDYNDGSALIGGALRTPLCISTDHFFEVRGAVEIAEFLGFIDIKGSPAPDTALKWEQLKDRVDTAFIDDGRLVPCRDMYAALCKGKTVFQ